MAEIGLKPCPFCGSYKFRIEKYGKNKNGGYRIICDSCNAGQHSWHVYKYLAIKAWNRRDDNG